MAKQVARKDLMHLKAIRKAPGRYADTWDPTEPTNVIEVSDEVFSKLIKGKFILRRTKHCDTWDPTQG